jgi:hypothetical protein
MPRMMSVTSMKTRRMKWTKHLAHDRSDDPFGKPIRPSPTCQNALDTLKPIPQTHHRESKRLVQDTPSQNKKFTIDNSP